MIALTIGTFDQLHVGHLELLRATRQMAERVVVSVNTDEFVLSYKGHSPVQSYAHRVEMLNACRYVDLVVPNVGGADATRIIEAIAPTFLTIGDDWLDPDLPGHDEARYFAQLGVTPEWMAQRGLHVYYIPRTRGVSSTAMRDYLEEPPSRPTWRIEGARVVKA